MRLSLFQRRQLLPVAPLTAERSIEPRGVSLYQRTIRIHAGRKRALKYAARGYFPFVVGAQKPRRSPVSRLAIDGSSAFFSGDIPYHLVPFDELIGKNCLSRTQTNMSQ